MICIWRSYLRNKWSNLAFVFTPDIFNAFSLSTLRSDLCHSAKAELNSCQVCGHQKYYYGAAYFSFFRCWGRGHLRRLKMTDTVGSNCICSHSNATRVKWSRWMREGSNESWARQHLPVLVQFSTVWNDDIVVTGQSRMTTLCACVCVCVDVYMLHRMHLHPHKVRTRERLLSDVVCQIRSYSACNMFAPCLNLGFSLSGYRCKWSVGCIFFFFF